jgi:hypothetical protein
MGISNKPQTNAVGDVRPGSVKQVTAAVDEQGQLVDQAI